jgi:hypothetical protein
LILYGVMLGYLYLKYKMMKDLITAKFKQPHYMKIIDISDADFLIIQEKLTYELMNQFIYECFGKDFVYEQLAEKPLVKKETKSKEKLKRSHDFKSEPVKDMNSKVITFLED